jgi:hypothetical protein
VLVRAEIGGKVYWRDGTRAGDRTLDTLPVPNYHWALPVRTAGAALEKLAPPPFDRPEEVTHLRLDASAGLNAPVPAHAEYVLRGDAGNHYKEMLADMSPDEADSYLRDYWRKEYDWIDIARVDAVFDEQTGEEHVSMDGTANMRWKGDGAAMGQHYEADGAVLGWKADYGRESEPVRDVPFSSRYPYYETMTETIVLPNGGRGFTVEGNGVDRKIGAWEFKRTAKIAGDVFTMEAGTRTVDPEFPAAEAKAVSSDLRRMSDLTVYLRAPIAAGKGGNAELASARVPGGCSADLAPIHADKNTVESQFAGQGTKP